MAGRLTKTGEASIVDLFEPYSKSHLALGLGAGVSQASRLPGWNELVCRIAEELPSIGRETANSLLAHGYDATVVATILRAKCRSLSDFSKLVRSALYRDFPFKQAVSERTYGSFAQHIQDTNSTLHAVGTFCGICDSDETFKPNSRVRAIVTLNIDALLEMYTRARFGSRVLRTIERASASASSFRIHCYHVHGYLVRTLTKTQKPSASEESDDRLILTEGQYFDVVANANGFVNYVLLSLLRDYRFLFIGLSMKDPNLRRALHLSFSERIRELQAEGETQAEAIERSTRHWAIMMRDSAELDTATTTLLEVIGVRPIWIKAWSEVPALLQQLYESSDHGARRWKHVA